MIRTVRKQGSRDLPHQWFTPKAMKRATSDFSHKNLLGQSQYAMVYQGELPDGTPVAIKKFKRNAPNPGAAIRAEFDVQCCIRHETHPEVRHLLAVSYDPEEPLIVYEYLSGGTLRQHLQGKRGKCLVDDAFLRLSVAIDVASALCALHYDSKYPVYHRDVKSANVLLYDGHRAKLADMGIAVVVRSDADLNPPQFAGSKGYTCPVYMKTGKLDDTSDVYSFGVLLMELATCSITTYETKRKNLLAERVLDKLRRGVADELIAPGGCPVGRPMMRDILLLAGRCCSSNLSSRPSMLDVKDELEAMQSDYDDFDETSYYLYMYGPKEYQDLL